MFWQCSVSWHRSCLALHGQQATSTITPTTVTPIASQDAVSKLLLNQILQHAERDAESMACSIEELDQLVAYIDQNQLYSDSSGNTYILKDDEKLLSYPQQQVVETWPSWTCLK